METHKEETESSLDTIFKKYGIKRHTNLEGTSALPKITKVNSDIVLLSDNDETIDEVILANQNYNNDLALSKQRPKSNFDLSDSDDNTDLPPSNFDKFDALLYSEIKYKVTSKTNTSKSPLRQRSTSSKQLEKELKRRISDEKKQAATIKKQETIKNKQIKKVLSLQSKQLKPEESIKFVTAILDKEITNNTSDSICNKLKELGSNYEIKSTLIPNSITWIRKKENVYIDDSTNELTTVPSTQEENDLLVILTADKVIELATDEGIVTYFKNLQKVACGKRISLGAIGLEEALKTLKHKKRKSELLSRENVLKQLTLIQIYCNCSYRNLSNTGELSDMIYQFTKAIAQRPYKLEQHEKHAQASWYMKGDNKDCVKVDKKGNGLKRLWQQQITSFPLTRLETAESIITQFPSVKSLFTAYDGLATTREKEQLLADIAIRRHAGPVSSSRRIGPELSKKIYVFYNSLDGEASLGSSSSFN